MANIDKAAIAFSIAITAIGVGIAFSGDSLQSAPTVSAPSTVVSTETEEPMQTDPFADLAAEVKSDPVEPLEIEEEPVVLDKEMSMEEPTSLQTHQVDIPVGTGVQGCEETNECYTPADITINAGDTVTWINVDSAVHTVTAGTPADAKLEVFHSDLMMPSSDSWSFDFEDAGTYDYFCIVHPWMVGSVTVN